MDEPKLVSTIGIEVGRTYLIKYRLSDLRTDRWSVGRLIDVNGDVLTWSGRPEYGTAKLTRGEIIGVERVPDNTVCYMDSRTPRLKVR